MAVLLVFLCIKIYRGRNNKVENAPVVIVSPAVLWFLIFSLFAVWFVHRDLGALLDEVL